MFKNYLIAAIGFMAAMCCSCSNENDSGASLDYIPFIRENVIWGLIGPYGQVLYENEFRNKP